MRIVFFCSSLEPGRDGVGDYVRLLASQLESMGHECIAVSINDEFVESVKEETQPIFGGEGLRVFRVPSKIAHTIRFTYIKNLVTIFKPEWVSLQYVGFGYHPYGLPYEMVRSFKAITNNIKVHLMFHELWCGMAQTAGIKEKILGKLQKLFIRWMVKQLKPAAIFTSIESYAVYLKNVGITASVVPIFSNIPFGEMPNGDEWRNLVKSAGIEAIVEAPDDWLVMAFFGTVYNRPGLNELIKNAAGASRQIDKKFGILSIGHGRGLDADALIKNIPGAKYWRTGALSPGLINKAMTIADLGVVTSTADGINKSGTAVAWLERGVPVIISGEDNSYNKNKMVSQGIYQILSAADVLLAIEARDNFATSKNLNLSADAYARLAES